MLMNLIAVAVIALVSAVILWFVNGWLRYPQYEDVVNEIEILEFQEKLKTIQKRSAKWAAPEYHKQW